MSADLPAAGPSPERRERVLDILSQHFAHGRIELEEMERRMEVAARAATAAELESALAGIVRAEPEAAPAAAGLPALRRERRRVGRWTAPRLMKASAVMGGMVLDYRDAVLAEGESEVELFVFWGGVQLIVPPDLEVEVEGSAFLGGIDNGAIEPVGQRRAGPRLRVRARVIMGGVEVKVMDREEPPAPGKPL